MVLSDKGTCNHDCAADDARYFAVVIKTSASASALGRGFSKANRILMDNRWKNVSRQQLEGRRSGAAFQPQAAILDYSYADPRIDRTEKGPFGTTADLEVLLSPCISLLEAA